jgi:prevent-host-death family protein
LRPGRLGLSLPDWTKEIAMRTVNIHEAKTQLSRLVAAAARGEGFIIAKAGRPLVKVVRLDAPGPGERRRTGFLAGQATVPDDFDTMGAEEIAALFGRGA